MALVKRAAVDGAEATRQMEAVKGRASYQTNKGVGHLDPGAVTMSYQIECLCDHIAENLSEDDNTHSKGETTMIKNTPSKTNDRTELLRSAIEHRATWMGLLIDEAKKKGLDTSFAHEAVLRCGMFHAEQVPPHRRPQEFARAFATEDVVNAFEMEILNSDDKHLHIDFHYCPLVSAWLKVGLPVEDIPELCEIAMDGDRGIIKTYDKFTFELGDTIAKGNDVCQIRIDKAGE